MHIAVDLVVCEQARCPMHRACTSRGQCGKPYWCSWHGLKLYFWFPIINFKTAGKPQKVSLVDLRVVWGSVSLHWVGGERFSCRGWHLERMPSQMSPMQTIAPGVRRLSSPMKYIWNWTTHIAQNCMQTEEPHMIKQKRRIGWEGVCDLLINELAFIFIMCGLLSKVF